MKDAVRAFLARALGRVPLPFFRQAAKLVFLGVAEREPRLALEVLLQFEADLSGQIDLAAMRYGHGVHVKHRLMRYHDFFVERIRATDRVIDIGCGYGAVAHSIAEQAGADVVGIDLSESNIAQARRQFSHPRLRFVYGDALLDLPDERFDVVVLSNVLEHIERRPDFLRRIVAKLHPQRLLIRVPMFDRNWHVPMRKELGLYYFSDPTHFTEYTSASFAREMEQAGLAILHQQVNWGELWAEVAVADGLRDSAEGAQFA